MTLFNSLPELSDGVIILRMMDETDVDCLKQITDNSDVYRYIAPFLQNKSKNYLVNAIRNLRGRDFEKQKLIITGIYMAEEPARLVGLAEMFDIKKRTCSVTVGYCINQDYWHRGIATRAARLMRQWLHENGALTVRACVLPQNVYSGKALLSAGFTLQAQTETVQGWGGMQQAEAQLYIG